MTRVYLPATLTSVAELHQRGELAASEAYAVTPALRERYGTGDEEELEYVAFTEAARAALRLLAVDPGAPRRRVVIAADAPAATPASPGDRRGGAAVRLGSPVPVAAVASIHVDGAAAEPDVAAAAAAGPAAAGGDLDAQLAVDAAEDHELAWYDVSELGQLLGA
jgi:hypothetical protein